MSASLDPADDVVPLTSAADDMGASLIVGALDEFGIKSAITGSAIADYRIGLPTRVQVLVKRADLERAKAALQSIAAEQQDVDWSQVDVGQPEP
jgi:hypothetical protein